MPKYIVVLEVDTDSNPEDWNWDMYSATIDVVCAKEVS